MIRIDSVQKSLSTQIMVLCLLLALVPTAFVAFYSSERIRSASFDLMVGRLKGNLFLVAEDFRQVIWNTQAGARLMSQADVFEGDDARAQVAYLDELRQENPELLDLVLYDLEGRKLVGTSRESFLPIGARQADRQIAALFEEARGGRQGDAFVAGGFFGAGQPAIVVATPITDDANATVVKVLMAFRTIGSLRAELDNLKQQGYSDVEYYLADGSDRVVLSTDPVQANTDAFVDRGTADFLAGQLANHTASGNGVHTNQAEQRILTLYSEILAPDQVLDMQWSVVASVPFASIEAPILNVRAEAMAISLACAALGTMFGLFAARRITHPLRQLVLWTRRLEAGNRADAVAVEGPEEVKVLGNALVAAFRRVAEHAVRLEHTTAALNQAQELSLIGSWHHDPHTGETWLSDEAYRLNGYEPGEHPADISLLQRRVHEEDRARVDAAIAGAIADRRPTVETEHRIQREDGVVRWMRALIALDFDHTGALRQMRGVFQDITLAKTLQEQLRQAQKMEAVGQLTGGVAHDFNNLLGAIIGNIELSADGLPESDPRRQHLEQALLAAGRGAKLTHRLLVFSRQQPLQPRVVDLNTTLRSMRELLNRTLGEPIEIDIITATGLWFCEVDPAQMESALLNLALNARDAMPDGGKLTIETGNAWLDDEYAAKEVDVAPGQYVMIAVSDTGTGMTQEVKRRAFDPFFTTKGAGAGSGLGLSMVHGFIKETRGNIKIYSEVGEGTTIRIYLPRSHVGSSDPTPPPGHDGVPRGRGEHVLVVEDDQNLRTLAVKMLRDLGYFVLDAADGAEALLIAERESRVDALLCDVVLPGGWNGPTLAARLHERMPNLAVLLMSGYTANAMVHQNRVDVGVKLLQKPFLRADLARAMREVLEG